MPKRSASISDAPTPLEVASRATAEGTARYASRFAPRAASDFYRLIGPLTASSLGEGTYLGDPTNNDDARYIAVIRQALRRGLNVIDTAINYRCQRSERAVGEALEQSLDAG